MPKHIHFIQKQSKDRQLFKSIILINNYIFLKTLDRTGYSCSVPLNIIIGVDNYTLRNGTKFRNGIAKKFLTEKKNKKKQVNVQEGIFFYQ